MSKTSDFLPPKKPKLDTITIRVPHGLFSALCEIQCTKGPFQGVSLNMIGVAALEKFVADLKAEKGKKS